ncbi:MAG: hemerythrin domain-containing protein [Elusimicrobia bacterium]|jgi:hemerythrin-like domain-containing protein|nr:hemerythrin domain-containing protein [Elusimicrobiota bacterium]
MTILQQLNDDHAYFKEVFVKLGDLATAPSNEGNEIQASELVQDFRSRHKLHLRRETEVLFPALLDAIQRDMSTIKPAAVLHHLQEEHGGIGRIVYLLEQELSMTPAAPAWITSFQKLVEVLVPHMKDEEDNVFPEAYKLLPQEQLIRMAQEVSFSAV